MKNYRKKAKQQQIDNILNIYAAIGAAAKEQPAPPMNKKGSHTLQNAPERTRTRQGI